MKKLNQLLCALMVPAMILQGGNTCLGNGGGPTPASLSLPASVMGIQTFSYSTATLYNFAVTSVSSAGVFTVGTTYGAWCTKKSGLVPGGGVNPNGTITPPEDPNNPSGIATYTPVDSYSITTSTVPSYYGVAGLTYDATIPGFTTTSLTLVQEWNAVNWILNNPTGTSGESPTTSDTQAAIWQLLHPDDKVGYVVVAAPQSGSLTTGSSWLLYKDALANGLNFVSAPGQFVGVLMVPTTPAGSEMYQGFVIPVPTTCTNGTGSATLTKTSNIGASGADAFQLVTYTYTIRNTGSTTLQNLVIVDDNGTPNYTGDDVTLTAPAGTTLAPGASYSLTSTVYLPISLFYQSGSQAAFDTLIPQVVPAPSGAPTGTMPSLLLTYLIDADVTDNTYGTGSSAGWAGNGGHTIAEIEAGYAEFAFYNSRGTVVSDFNADYISNVGVSAAAPSGLASIGVIGSPIVGGKTYITNIDSTLADNLNNFPQFVNDTVNSPVAGTPNWQTIAGYKVLVNQGIFGVYGIGSAAVKKNYLAATETSFSGKCGYPRPTTYTPCIYGNIVTSTAYLCAQVCGCSTIVHAKACLTVKLCGSSKPGCNSYSNHQCQNPVHCDCNCSQCNAGNHGKCTNTGWFGFPAKCTPPVCSCTCIQCKAGNHGSCSQVGCTDPTCHANNCGHNTVQCMVAAKSVTYSW